jgi:hypothetical protein
VQQSAKEKPLLLQVELRNALAHFLVEGLRATDRAVYISLAEELATGTGRAFPPRSLPLFEGLRAVSGRGEEVLGRRDVTRRFGLYALALDRAPAGIDLAARLAQARVLLDLQLFFEAHEILEPAWVTAKGEVRGWLQGVIQAAVAWAHMEAGNRAGALGVAIRAAENLEGAPDSWARFDLGSVRSSIQAWARWLDRPESDAGPPPPIPGGQASGSAA